LSLRATQLSCL